MKLSEMSRDNKLSARINKRVLILFALDANNKPKLYHRQIASALNTSGSTIVAVAKDYSHQGLDYALAHHFNPASVKTNK